MKLTVIGPGRAGTAIHQHACHAGLACTLGRTATADVDVVLIAVPDPAVAEVAQAIPVGPLVGMVSGSVPLSALAPHAHAFVMHPMQTIQPDRDDLQLTGCAAGITSTDEATAATASEASYRERLRLEPVAAVAGFRNGGACRRRPRRSARNDPRSAGPTRGRQRVG